MTMLLRYLLLICGSFSFANSAYGQDTIRYDVTVSDPAAHYIHVAATYPVHARRPIELMMATWTPGSYLIREFSRHVEGLTAQDERQRPLTITKLAKNRWRIAAPSARLVRVSYRLYANEHMPRTNWVGPDFALLNGAATFLTLATRQELPHDVTLHLPTPWSQSATALPRATDKRAHHYVADNFDALVDSPILLSRRNSRSFVSNGATHTLVTGKDTTVWKSERALSDLVRIVAATQELWRIVPFDHYLFLILPGEDFDGIEHRNSTALVVPPNSTTNDSLSHEWQLLAAHEYFHAWNGKRLRPIALGPFDYERENYTESLWITEGLSDYFSWLVLAHAGLSTTEQFLADASQAIRELQSTPGRKVQSLSASSFDAWIKQYRPDENSKNSAISYYTKGSVVGLLLDSELRRLTNGQKTLADVMRTAYARYSGVRGFTPAEFRAVAEEAAGVSLKPFFASAVESTEELNYDEMLRWYGLAFDAREGAAPWSLVERTDATAAQRARLQQLVMSTPSGKR